jgi:hypothetical protein
VARVTLLGMTVTVLEPPVGLSEPLGVAGYANHVDVSDAGEQPLAYSDMADEWYWVPVETVATSDNRGHTVPADVFLMVQAILLIEAVLAIASLQGRAWHPLGVLVIVLLVVALSANFVAGVAAARAARTSPSEDSGERGTWFIAGLRA